MPTLFSAHRLVFFAMFGVLSASVFACSTKESPPSSSGDDDDDSTTSDNKGGTSSTSSSYCCGLNGEYWDCPSSKALDRCADLDNPDPSDCTKRTKACSGSESSTSTDTPSDQDDPLADCERKGKNNLCSLAEQPILYNCPLGSESRGDCMWVADNDDKTESFYCCPQ